MPVLVKTADAARRLGVEPATLYAYVSRGLLPRQRAADGRTSLFRVEDLDALAQRGRRRAAAIPPASVDVQITTRITEMDEGDLRYRGHSVATLARSSSFEQVAELLWTGDVHAEPVTWPAPAAEAVAVARGALHGLGPATDASVRLAAMLTALASHDPFRGDRSAASVSACGRRVLPVLAGAFGSRVGARRASIAERLSASWCRRPEPGLVDAVDRALVLVADHELATSTLAVRVAASTWADPYFAMLAGLGAMSGPLHGAAGAEVVSFLRRCEADGVAATFGELLRQGARVPGFGHKVYRGIDPRVEPLLEEVRALGAGRAQLSVVDEVLEVSAVRLTRQPNVDLAMGALAYVCEHPVDVGLVFTLGRMAGWLAHAMEEYAEAPLRFRATGRYVGPPAVESS